MRLKASNLNLTDNQPTTILTASCVAGATTLTVANNGGFTNGDFLLIGKLGEEKTEIVKIGGAITAGTSITIGATVFAHDQDTSITRIDFNYVRFYRGTTIVAGDSSALAAAQKIDPTEEYSYYEDNTYTTGYGFVRFNVDGGTTYSAFSDAIPYTGYTDKMLRIIREKVRRLINEVDEINSAVDNDEIDDEINLAQKEIAHDRMWSFYEKTKSFSSVANQYEYELASDVFTLYDAKYDTQPLAPISLHRFNQLRWDSDTTGDPTHICMWRRKARVYPYPSASASTTTLTGTHSDTITTITVASTANFQTQGRIIIEDEVISYTGKTTTTFTGCTRGEEDTTAATHTVITTITVTERDFIYHFQEEPEDLSNETDETEIPEPSILAYKAGAEIALGVLEKETLHDRLLVKYERALTQLRKVDEPKIKVAFGRVKNIENTITDQSQFKNPNDYPTNLTD